MEKIYNNLFECEYPVIDNLIWKKHPKFPIEISNYGHYRNPKNEADNYNKTGKVIGILEYEAFHNTILKPYTYVIHKNMNPYDYRVDNLMLAANNDRARLKKEQEFIRNTVNEMLRKESDIPAGIDPEDYWIQLGIPKRYMTYWRKVKLTNNSKL